jgi:hypothetical protein
MSLNRPGYARTKSAGPIPTRRLARKGLTSVRAHALRSAQHACVAQGRSGAADEAAGNPEDCVLDGDHHSEHGRQAAEPQQEIGLLQATRLSSQRTASTKAMMIRMVTMLIRGFPPFELPSGPVWTTRWPCFQSA